MNCRVTGAEIWIGRVHRPRADEDHHDGGFGVSEVDDEIQIVIDIDLHLVESALDAVSVV